MSWLTGDVSALDLHEAHGGHGLVSAGLEEVQAQNRRLQALLSTEQDAHRMARERLEERKKDVQGYTYKLQEAASRVSELEGDLAKRKDEIRLQHNQRANLEITLRDAQARLVAQEKQRSLEFREAGQADRYELERISNQLEEVISKSKITEDGEKLWKNKCEFAEREKERLERLLSIPSVASSSRPRTRSQDKEIKCSDCAYKDEEIASMATVLGTIEAEHAQLVSQKTFLDATHLHLINQHAALERSSSGEREKLRESLSNVREEMDELRLANEELERVLGEKVEDNEKQLTQMQRERELSEMLARDSQDKVSDLQLEMQEHVKASEALKAALDNVTTTSTSEIASLNAQILSLETHFQTYNSDLLSSRAALTHTQSKLAALELLLSQVSNRSYDDEYVLNLRNELEDEIKLRGDLERGAEEIRCRISETWRRTKADEEVVAELSDTSREILRHQLGCSQSHLGSTEIQMLSLNAEQEALHLRLGHLRSELTTKDVHLVKLESEIADLHSMSKVKDQQIINAREDLGRSMDIAADKEAELLVVFSELESLKRDASALRDQLLNLHQHQKSAGRKSPSPPKTKHCRTSSAPFSPSPLRHASFPPPPSSLATSSSSSSFTPIPKLRDAPDKDSSREDQTIVLVSRLRQERDEAISQLSYYLLEHRISAECLQDELKQISVQRDLLREELDGMALKDETAKAVLEEKLDVAEQKEADARNKLQEAMDQIAGLRDLYDEKILPVQQIAVVSTHNPASSSASADEITANLYKHMEILESLLATAKHAERERMVENKQILDERDSISDSLTATTTELQGARNTALDLQRRFEKVRDELSRLEETTSSNTEHWGDQLEQAELQLDGARNAALELEIRLASMSQDRAMIEISLRQQRDSLFQQLLVEYTTKDVLQHQVMGMERVISEGNAKQEEQGTDIQNMIIALIQASQQRGATNANVGNLKGQLQDARAGMEIARHELQKIQSEHLAENQSRTVDNDKQEQLSQALIFYLVQASKELCSLRQALLDKRAQLDLESRNASQLRLELKFAHQDIARLQDQLAGHKEMTIPTADHCALQEDMVIVSEQLREAREVAESYQCQVRAAREKEEVKTTEIEHLHAEISELRCLQDEFHHAEAKEVTLLARLEAETRTAAEQKNVIHQLQEELNHKEGELVTMQENSAKGQEDIRILSGRLRIVEEEGRNLVIDFNLLSEELENRQKEDDTRTVHTELQNERLLEAEAARQELTQKSDEATATLQDMGSRLKRLEEELENKQSEVEETDDRYLASLKTIKKQEIALDRLKVRIEALQRANGLLSKAVPASTPDVMAPAPPSVKKRALPQDFVAPDLGPVAVVTTVVTTERSFSIPKSPENISSSKIRLNDKLRTHKDGVTKDVTTGVKTVSEMEADNALSMTTMSLTSQNKPRKPLATVQPQAATTQSQTGQPVKGSEPIKPAKLGSIPTVVPARPPFKPTLSARPLPSNRTEAKDTKSLLAALQALKRAT